MYYENNKGKILNNRKNQRSAVPPVASSKVNEEAKNLTSFFPSRTGKKRAIDKVKNALPESPRKRAEVLAALLDSPKTQKSLSHTVAINTPEQQEEVKLAKAVITDVSTVLEYMKHKRSDGARSTMRVGLSMLCGASVAEGNMRKTLAEALNINRCRVAMSVQQEKSVFCDKAALWECTKRRTRCDAIPEEQKLLAQDFWSSPGISRTTGNKKDCKKSASDQNSTFGMKNKFWKKQTEVYKEFRNKYPDIHMGQRAFEKCKPFYVIEPRPQDRQSCCCCMHVEICMLFKECMTFRREVLKGKPEAERKRYPVFEHITDLVEETMCNKGDAPYHKLACIDRQCEDCGIEKLQLLSEEKDTSLSASLVTWEKFEYVPVPGVAEEKKAIKDCEEDYDRRGNIYLPQESS